MRLARRIWREVAFVACAALAAGQFAAAIRFGGYVSGGGIRGGGGYGFALDPGHMAVSAGAAATAALLWRSIVRRG